MLTKYVARMTTLMVGVLLAQTAAAVIKIYPIEAISPIPVLPETRIQNKESANKVIASASLGETFSSSVVVLSSRDHERASIRMSELKGTSAVLDPNIVGFRVVKVWYQSGTAWSSVRFGHGRRLVPELLLHDEALVFVDPDTKNNFVRVGESTSDGYVNVSDESKKVPRINVISATSLPVRDSKSIRPFSLIKNQAKQIWLTWRIPASAEPGTYTGEVVVDASTEVAKVPVELVIHPFELVESPLEYSIFYRGQLALENEATISSDEKSVAQMLAELRNMRDHGVTNPTVYQDPKSLALVERVLETRAKAGISAPDLFYVGLRTENPLSERAVEQYIQLGRRVARVLPKYGLSKLLVYGIDEGDEDAIAIQKDVWLALRKLGFGVFVSNWRKIDPAIYGPTLDVFVDGRPPDESRAYAYHKYAARIMSYNIPQVGIEDPYAYRAAYGLRLWRNGYDGAMLYAYQDGFGSVWNDFDHERFRDHNFTYPTVDGVIDTIAWEGFREGVTDVRYVATLERLLERIGSSNDSRVRNAHAFLKQLKNDEKMDLSHSRLAIATFITELQVLSPRSVITR